MVREHYVPQDSRVAREVDALAALGCHVDVICLRDDDQPGIERRPGVTVWRLPLRHSRGRRALRYLTEYGAFFVMAGGLVTLLHLRHRYRLIQVNSLPDALVFAAAVPRLLGAPVLLDLQECMPEFFATKFGVDMAHRAVRAIARVEQASIRFANRVITPTAQMREAFIARGAPQAKITVVMDGADQEVFHPIDVPRTETDDRSFTLVSHGTVEAHYGLDTVIEAVALLRDEIPQLRFEVYGDGSDLARLRRLAAELRVTDRVWFSGGFVPIDQLVAAIARADVGVVAMKRDPFRDVTLAGKMFDFIAMGKPVVSSRTRSVEQTFDASAVELFESGDAGDLARALRTLHAEPARRARMAERAAELADGYQWSRQRQIYGGVVSHLLDGAALGRSARRRIGTRRGRLNAGTEFEPPPPR
ncbi:glycosyltransferase family 4 protein [Planosporangium thailandense]|uniref:Glycosyltransferase family 4 protein n=1 Tax=Planosporangium thailandense TaxID=765197 RepID=A0ABX0XZN2_9ACTN|nr:glycosyltransferase family 4 protein [Planosporangium thailandense]